MFVENTKYMLYLVFVFPVLILLSFMAGVALKGHGFVWVLAFTVSMSLLIAGLLVYAKLPNLKSGKIFEFGIDNIRSDRRWSYKLSFHFLIAYFFVALVLISKAGQ